MALVANKVDLQERRQVGTQVITTVVIRASFSLYVHSHVKIPCTRETNTPSSDLACNPFSPFLLQEAMDYAEANGLFFTETSAKTAQNVSELFYELGKCLLSQLQ